MSYACPYVHHKKLRQSLQGYAGSFIRRDGTFGEVRWAPDRLRAAPGRVAFDAVVILAPDRLARH
jgi:hypothetical protein